MSEISTLAIPNRHIAVLKQRVPGELALRTRNLCPGDPVLVCSSLVGAYARSCKILEPLAAGCRRYHLLCSWCSSPGTSMPTHAQRSRGCASTPSTGSLPMPRPPPSRTKNDGPKLTSVGKLFSFEPLNGYVGSFGESPKQEIKSARRWYYLPSSPTSATTLGGPYP